jgi:hypothetical protein
LSPSQRTNARRADLLHKGAKTHESMPRERLDALLARLIDQVPTITKMIDAAEGNAVAFSSLEGPVMALFATLDAADDTADELAVSNSSDRVDAESAKAAVELARLSLVLTVTRCPVDYAA